MAFSEIPAISIYNKTIVLAREGKYESLTIDDKVPDPLDLIEIITENYPKIYLSDINGLTQNKPQLKMIRQIVDLAEVWVEAGVNSCESVYDLLVAGAHEVVIASKTIPDLFQLAESFDLTENIIFELDYSGTEGVLSPNPRLSAMQPQELAKEIAELGIKRLIFADLDRIGNSKPIEQDVIRSLTKLGLQVYVGGGIRLKDISTIKYLGASAAILELTNVLSYGKVDF
jgi:uncharacterized protein related to proFAR isomerase